MIRNTTVQNIARLALGGMLITTGIGHLTFARKPFQAQVPDWVPLDKDTTVVWSGWAELAIAAAIIASPKKYRPLVGLATAAFFVAVYPGNISQYTHKRDMPGLETDQKRFTRLFFQPVLVAWALYSMGSTKKSVLKELSALKR